MLSEAGDYVSTVAWHCYAPNNNWDVLSQFHDSNPSVKQYMTECYTSTDTPWSQAADFTIGPLQNWGSGVMAWTLGTDDNQGPHLSTSGACTNCRGLVTVDNGSVTRQVDYYMMGQFSRYIPVGATVLSSDDGGSGGGNVESVVTLNPDGTRTVVIVNKGGDVTASASFQTGGDSWTGDVPGQSVVSWVLPASS